jgi:pumilio family protein 6
VQKEMLRQRQAAKPHASLLAEAKQHWSLARQRTLPKAEREKHAAKLLEAVRGKVQDLVFKHDASRVVQTVREACPFLSRLWFFCSCRNADHCDLVIDC